MKTYEQALKELEAKYNAKNKTRAVDVEIVQNALKALKDISKEADKELKPALKRLSMFIDGERYTRGGKTE